MAISPGTLDTRILLAIGDGRPVEVGTLTTRLAAGKEARGRVVISMRRWRLGLTVAFLHAAWVTATAGEEKHRTTDPACTNHRAPHTPWQVHRYNRARGRSCPACAHRDA